MSKKKKIEIDLTKINYRFDPTGKKKIKFFR